MAGTTTNNGWTYPTSTDLVTNGASAIQTLATGIDTSTGKGLLAWQSYACTLSGGWANGNGTMVSYYNQMGKTVNVRVSFVIGSTTTKGTGLNISLPVNAQSAIIQNNQGIVQMTAAGTATYVGSLVYSSSGAVTVNVWNASGTYVQRNGITATVPATWATGDAITLAFSYEAA